MVYKTFNIKKLVLIFILSCSISSGAADISIIYPAEHDTIDAAVIDSNFILGQVSPPNTQLFINSTPIKIHENGSFLTFLPIEHGPFIYSCLLMSENDTAFVQRSVFYKPPPHPIKPDSLVIDTTLITPQRSLELLPGDIVQMGFRGTPGCRATFRINGLVSNGSMQEVFDNSPVYWADAAFTPDQARRPQSIPAVYRGSYLIQPRDSVHNAPIHFPLVNDKGDTVRAQTAGNLSIDHSGAPRVAQTKLDLTILRTGPKKSYYYFCPQGVKLWITGKNGSNYRVRLSETLDAWIEDYKIQFLKAGTPAPHHYIRAVRTADVGDKARVTVFGEHRLPYRIVQSVEPNQLKIIFYGVTADTDWIRYDLDAPLIQSITWEQLESRVYALYVNLAQKHPWGYDAGYDEQDNFFLDIQKTPRVGWLRCSTLKHLTILLDPGHEPDTGAVGPTGFKEKDANLLLAHEVAKKLRRRGATVKFTRQEEGLSLADRLELAMSTEADMLLSLHHNAVPAGINPLKHRGSSTFYYHPQSYQLAYDIHTAMLKKLGLPNFGFYWDNLAMCRLTQMPAVLIEPAFMIHPEEEELIQSEKYRQKCAKAIINGVIDFVRRNKE